MANSKALPPTYLLLTMAVMVVLHLLFPLKKLAPYPTNLLGCIPLLAGIALNLMADRALKAYETTVKPFQGSTALVTTGLLVYEHRLIAPDDLSRLNIAFFNMNSYISMTLFTGVLLALVV